MKSLSAYFFSLQEIILRCSKDLSEDEHAMLPPMLHDLANENNQ